MNEPLADPLVGKIVSQYEILAKLGGGGMGVVYKARDTKLGRSVALKFLPPQFSRDEDAKQRFVREAQAASATNHPNICTIHNIEQTDDGQLFIVMAHYEGETLKQRLERGPLAVDEALSIARAVAEGLARAHAQGVVHRDIKPGNLMITEDGVRILDFGLAKLARAQEQLTMAGSTVGTIAYMSPEQARGEEADARSDIWALGVVLYEMVTGQLPFKGPYPDATFYAIKNEPPPPLRTPGRDIPESVELLVRGALEKDPDRRFQTARDLVRALVLVQGRSIPLDFRTGPVPQPVVEPQPPVPRRWVTRRRALVAGVALAVVSVGLYVWLSWLPRVPVAIVPVANHTGDPGLEAYRLAFTEMLVEELSDSPNIRVLPYVRLLEIIRPFVEQGAELARTDAIQAISTLSAARFVVLPSLENRNGTWVAQARFRNIETGTDIETYETEGVASALAKEKAYQLIVSLAERVQEYFRANGPRRSYRRRPPGSRLRTLDAARAFEHGLNAYEQMEYAAGLDAFQRAAELDPQHPMTHAWMSRGLQLMSRNREAEAAGRRARQLVTEETPRAHVLFIDATLAESLRDVAGAEERYRRLAELRPDDGAARAELADFLTRQLNRNQEAIEAYHEVLALDEEYIRPHVALCVLYTRLADYPLAEQHARTALDRHRAIGNRAGEAQARLCLAEAEREQGGEHLAEAGRHVEEAHAIFDSLGQAYNLSRVYQYRGVVEYSRRNLREAAHFFEQALSRGVDVGNRQIESVALMNLGVVHQQLGQRTKALEYYQQSREFYEQIGEPRSAAEQEVNIASLLIDFGFEQPEVLQRLAVARVTLQKAGFVDFELGAKQAEAAAHRHAGRHSDALSMLNAALSIARERQLSDRITSITVDIAGSHFLLNDYGMAKALLEEAVTSEAGRDDPEARIELGRVHARLGGFDVARSYLDAALAIVEERSEMELAPLAHLALGEWAYESGDLPPAREHFDRAAAFWTAELPDPASIEARCYQGLLDTLTGNVVDRRERVEASVEQARKMGRFYLQARCLVHLARIHVRAERYDDALKALEAIPPDRERSTMGPELRAEALYWRGRALVGRADTIAAQTALADARNLVQDLQDSLPEPYQKGFASRIDIRRVIEAPLGDQRR